MQERKHASSRTRRRPVAAFVAVLLAFALAFMAFEPNTLRSAFATNGEAATADADAQENGDLQAIEPAEDELEEDGADEGDDDAATGEASAVEGDAPAEEEAVAEDPVAVTDEGEGGDDARAGPSGETDLSGESPNTAEAEVEAKAERAFKTRTASASCTVTFYSNVASESPSILARKLVTAEAGQTVQVVVGDVVASAPTGAEAFDGWLYGGETHTDSIEIDPQDGDVRLYPVFSSGHWLRFVEGDSGSDAVYVPSQFIGATEQVPAALPTTTREGYTFAGWFTGSISNGVISYGTRMTDENGMVLDSDSLRSMLRASDVVLYASWQAVETTYRVITLYQNPEGDGYSYQGSVTVGGDGSGEVISGEMTDVSQLPEVPGFTAKEIKQERIKGDGSTVVNAYYDRNMYKVVFHKERSDSSDLFHELTIEARYGADIHDKWPKPSATGEYSTSWYTLTDPNSNVFVTGIGTMPLGGAKYYRMENKGTECNTKFMIQNIDGTNNFTEYGSQPFSTTHSTATTADDYKPIKGFMVNAASEADMLAIQRIPAGDKAATYNADFKRSAAVGASYNNAPTTTDEGDVARHTLYFYYLRCQYDIVFEENGGNQVDDIKGVYYEAPLADFAPHGYVVGETRYTSYNGEVYEFAGWYDNPEFGGDPFVFDSKTMPAGNVVLYADWKPARHLVQVDPAGGEFVNPAQSTYFWVDHGNKLDYIDAERHYVADDNGAYVYDYETASSDGDDQFGSAMYVTAQADDTGQRYSWSENAYSLYGWYRIDDAALAETPFDFNAGITEDTSIVARWRAVGMFDIAYNPTMRTEGGSVTGRIDVRLDPGYADLSPTYVVNTPDGITSTDGADYEFIGWKVVEHFDEGAEDLAERLYVEGDGFVVDSELATNNTIHLQALYEEVPADPVDPSDPVDPVDPEDPADPADPADPTDPADPVEPAAPATPTTPTSSGGTSQRPTVERALFPQTGDEAQMLAVGIAGMALLSLGIALIARAMRRNSVREE